MEDEDDDISGDDEVMLNSSIAEGAVTRALYGDEEGIACPHHLTGCYGDLCDIRRINYRPR